MNATTHPPRTEADIARLKADWTRDPAWDIETTEGFEAHHGELLAFRRQFETQVMQAADQRTEALAKSLGISTALAKTLETLEANAGNAAQNAVSSLRCLIPMSDLGTVQDVVTAIRDSAAATALAQAIRQKLIS